MRKFLIVALVLVLALGASLGLIACSGDVDLPGLKWTNEEILTYEIYDGATLTGALVITTSRIGAGEQTLESTGTKHNVTATTVKGTRVKMGVSDLNGNILMTSESILNGFTTLASAKKVVKDGVETTTYARYDGKRYYYSVNGGEEQKIKIKTGFVDNELLYTVLRAYSIEDSYTGSYTVIDSVQGEKVKMSIATSKTDVYYKGTLHDVAGASVQGVEITSDGVTQPMKTDIKCVELQIQRATAPVGAPIYVTYSIEGESGLSVIGEGKTNHYSTHVPVMIVENNLTYKLSSISCK